MQWYHETKKEWLDARRNCLTATDVKDLLPVTKTGRKRVVDDESYIKVLARKLAPVSDDDVKSNGAAARGHVLEQFAISMFNANVEGANLQHWDDVVVTREPHEPYRLAFSPDALDARQPEGEYTVDATPEMTHLGEVKSYYPERHLLCGYTAKENLEERWQVAVAMAVADSIEKATIIFYNPSMEPKMYVVEYSREDLKDEIETVIQVEKDWLEFVDQFEKKQCNKSFDVGLDEKEIVDVIVEVEELNPDGHKSVVL